MLNLFLVYTFTPETFTAGSVVLKLTIKQIIKYKIFWTQQIVLLVI